MTDSEFIQKCRDHHARLCVELRQLMLKDHPCVHCGANAAGHLKDGTARCSVWALSRRYESSGSKRIDEIGKLLAAWDTVFDLQMQHDPSWS